MGPTVFPQIFCHLNLCICLSLCDFPEHPHTMLVLGCLLLLHREAIGAPLAGQDTG